MRALPERSDGTAHSGDEEIENNPPKNEHKAAAMHMGRRGPGIYRHVNTESELSLRENLELVTGTKRLSNHIKPSLTPGLGTRRVVSSSSGQDKKIKFTMEPRPGDEAFHEWREAMRLMARLGDGLPKFVRRRVWSTLADRRLAKQHVDWPHVVRLAFNDRSNPDDDSLGSQIVKDLHRTGCDQFGSDEDRAALKRVLLAYARWNKRVGYCQGFNVIAAAILDVMDRDEKEAFKIMVYLIDYVLPESYFAQNLQALSVDIAVFRHLLQAKLPRLSAHLDRLQYKAAVEANARLGQPAVNPSQFLSGRAQGLYEPPLMNVYIIQWFLTLFATCLAPDAVLRIWDSILLEGSEIILRTAVVIMDFLASRLMKLKSADQFYGTMANLIGEFAEGRIVSTRELVFEIYQLAPFPYLDIKELRDKFTYNISPLVRDPITDNKTILSPNPKGMRGPETNGVKRFRLLGRWKSEQKEDSNEAISSPRKIPDSVTGKSISTSCTVHTLSDADKRVVKKNNQNASLSQEDDGYQEISLVPSTGDDPKRKFSLFRTKKNKNPCEFQDDQLSKRCADARLRENHENQDIDHHPTSFTTSLPQTDRTLCYSSEVLKAACSGERRKSLNNLTTNKEHIDLKQKKVDRKVSLQIGLVTSDISKLGPGAVGETAGVKPDVRSPLAHQARMSTKLAELQSQYRRQVNRQRRSTLLLPDMWTWEECTHSNRICFNETMVTAVLPQSRQSKPMDFGTSFHLESAYKFSENCPPNENSQHSPLTDDVFYDPVSDSRNSTGPVNEASRKSSIMLLSDLREALLVDPDLQGTVKSWQAKAIWSSRPFSWDFGEASEADSLNHIHQTASGGSDDKKKPTDTKNGVQDTKRPVDSEMKQSTDKKQNTLRDLASSVFAKESSDHAQAVNCTTSVLQNGIGGEISSKQHDAETFGTPLAISVDEMRRFRPPFQNDAFFNVLSEHITRQNEVNSLDELNSEEQQDTESSITETDSYFTSISQQTVKRAPWEDSTLFSRRRTSVTSTTKPTHGLQLPLSPTRRQFGAQFGLYKTTPSPPNRSLATFCDRVQYVNLTRHALARHTSNCS